MIMENKHAFVIYPHPKNDEEQPNLTPKDKLIYLAIRKHADNTTLKCFPSYATITSEIGASSKTIKKCVENLEREGYIKTSKDGRKIVYQFNNQKYFEKFSEDFLYNKDLTFTQKAYLVSIQQYMFKDESKQEGRITYSNRELATKVNMSDSVISRVNHQLEEKGFLEGAGDTIKRFKLGKLLQGIILWNKELDDRITSLESKDSDKDRRIRQLELEIEALKQGKINKEFII